MVAEKTYMKTKDVAKRLFVKEKAVLRLVKQGKLKPAGSTPGGGTYLYHPDDIEAFADANGVPKPILVDDNPAE